MSRLPGELPRVSPYAVALPALHWKVTLEELNVDPGGGLSISAGPVGGGVGVGVGVGVLPGVGVGVGPAGYVGHLNAPMRVTQCNGLTGTYVFECHQVQWST